MARRSLQVAFQQEVATVEQADLRARCVLRERQCPLGPKDLVVAAPHRQAGTPLSRSHLSTLRRVHGVGTGRRCL